MKVHRGKAELRNTCDAKKTPCTTKQRTKKRLKAKNSEKLFGKETT